MSPFMRFVAAASVGTLLACSGGATSDPPVAAQRPWTSSSSRIEASSFSYPAGLLRFDATRAQLTSDGLARVAGLETVSPNGGCPLDLAIATVVVHDAGGASVTYKSVEGDYDCGDGAPLLKRSLVQPFLDALRCVRSGMPSDSGDGPADAKTMQIDDGCFNGVRGWAKGEVSWLKLHVTSTTRAVRITATDCAAGDVAVALYDGAATGLLAQAEATVGDASACAALEHTFAETGDYFLRVAPTGTGARPQVFLRATSR